MQQWRQIWLCLYHFDECFSNTFCSYQQLRIFKINMLNYRPLYILRMMFYVLCLWLSTCHALLGEDNQNFQWIDTRQHQHQSSLIVVTVVPEAAGGSPAKYVILNMSLHNWSKPDITVCSMKGHHSTPKLPPPTFLHVILTNIWEHNKFWPRIRHISPKLHAIYTAVFPQQQILIIFHPIYTSLYQLLDKTMVGCCIADPLK